MVLSGPDVGFRIERFDRGSVIGTWMVRIDGEWMPAHSAMRTIPAHTR